MKREPLGHWWTFSMPRPPLLYLQIQRFQENGYLSHIWLPGSLPLLFLQDSGAADPLGGVYLQLHVPLHSLKFAHLDPLTTRSPSTTGAFFFYLLDISLLHPSPCHEHSSFLDHLAFTKWNNNKKNCINLFTSSICILKNELYTVLMHEKKHDKAKRKSCGCA